MLYRRSFIERYVIFISGNQLIRVLGGSLLDQVEQGTFFFLAVDDEYTSEYFMAAVFRGYLGETEHLAIGQLTSQLLAYLVQVSDLLLA